MKKRKYLYPLIVSQNVVTHWLVESECGVDLLVIVCYGRSAEQNVISWEFASLVRSGCPQGQHDMCFARDVDDKYTQIAKCENCAKTVKPYTKFFNQ